MDAKKVETEEELRERLKEELKAELLAELKEEQKNKKEKSKDETYEYPQNNVKFNSYNDKGIKEATDLLNKDKKFGKNDDVPKAHGLPQAQDSESGSTFSLVLVVAVIGIIISSYMLLPKIYQWAANKGTPSTYKDPNAEKPAQNVEIEKINLNSERVKNLTYPVMRVDQQSKKTYYSKSVVNVGDFSNNDLLYNAFIHIYEGNIANYKGKYSGDYCGNKENKKTFSARYIDTRMDNLFTTTVDYEYKSFTVPSYSKETPYVGLWKYDEKNHRYIYYGDCNLKEEPKTVYYDLRFAYDAKGLNNNAIIEVYNYVAFAKVNNGTGEYAIYSDVNMDKKILEGILTSANEETELNQIFKAYIEENNETNKYKYTFSREECSYENHCFVKGEWLE